MDKKQARKYVKEIKKTLSESEVIERSKNVINRIYGLSQYKNSVNILTLRIFLCFLFLYETIIIKIVKNVNSV